MLGQKQITFPSDYQQSLLEQPIREAFKNAKSKYDKEHVTPYIKRNYQCSIPKKKIK